LEVAQTREAARAAIFGPGDYPQILFRIGWAPVNADPLPSTPRRTLSEVVERFDGSAFDEQRDSLREFGEVDVNP
jgi:hypothetical protein